MARWSDYTTGERIKILRGSEMTQERLAEAAGLSVATIRKAERDLGLGLPSLLRISAALHADVSVILGQQEPRRAMHRDDRAMLRELSRAVHDTAAGVGMDEAPPSNAEFVSGLAAAWNRYRAGEFATVGSLASLPCVRPPLGRGRHRWASSARRDGRFRPVVDLSAGLAPGSGRGGRRAVLPPQSVLTQSARNRLMLDVASAQCDTRQWDASLDTVLQVCTAHPSWARHQALPDAIARRVSHANVTTSRFRKLSAILETSQTIR